MSQREDLDAKLSAYLDGAERDRDEGNTIANLRIEIHSIRADMNELAAEHKMVRLRLDRHGRDIRDLKQHVFHRSDETDTGVHQIEDLRKHLEAKESELKERRDSTWWRRQKIQWFVAFLGAIGMLFLGGAGTVIWFFFTQWAK